MLNIEKEAIKKHTMFLNAVKDGNGKLLAQQFEDCNEHGSLSL